MLLLAMFLFVCLRFSSNNKANFNLHIEAELPDSWESFINQKEKPPYLVRLVYESKDSRRADFTNLSQVSEITFSENFLSILIIGGEGLI